MDSEAPSEEQWVAYIDYLQFLLPRVIALREFFKFSNDEAATIND